MSLSENKMISSSDLKTKLGTSTFFKFLREDLTHRNFTYKLGENVDVIPFNPSGRCKAGGLYFTTINHIFEFMDFGTQIGIIMLCPDSKVYIEEEGNKYKTDKFIIEEVVSVEEFIDRFFPPLVSETVEQNGLALRLIENQTDEICLKAVKQNGFALRYVNNKTDKICLEAVKQNGLVLRFVEKRTPEICSEAMRQNYRACKIIILSKISPSSQNNMEIKINIIIYL
jgi:hypothetical protein